MEENVMIHQTSEADATYVGSACCSCAICCSCAAASASETE